MFQSSEGTIIRVQKIKGAKTKFIFLIRKEGYYKSHLSRCKTLILHLSSFRVRSLSRIHLRPFTLYFIVQVFFFVIFRFAFAFESLLSVYGQSFSVSRENVGRTRLQIQSFGFQGIQLYMYIMHYGLLDCLIGILLLFQYIDFILFVVFTLQEHFCLSFKHEVCEIYSAFFFLF